MATFNLDKFGKPIPTWIPSGSEIVEVQDQGVNYITPDGVRQGVSGPSVGSAFSSARLAFDQGAAAFTGGVTSASGGDAPIDFKPVVASNTFTATPEQEARQEAANKNVYGEGGFAAQQEAMNVQPGFTEGTRTEARSGTGTARRDSALPGEKPTNTQGDGQANIGTDVVGVDPFDAVAQQLQGIQRATDILAAANKAGLKTSATTTVQEAERFLRNKNLPVPGQVSGKITKAPPASSQDPVPFDYVSALGIDPKALQVNPIGEFESAYKNIYRDLGLQDTKSRIDQITRDFEELENEKAEKARNINDDPWLTEGVRINRLRKLDEEYEDRELILSNRLGLEQSTFESGLSEARFFATAALNQANANRSFAADQIEFAIERADKQMAAHAALEQQMFENELALEELGIDKAQLEIDLYKATSGDGNGGGLTPYQLVSLRNQIEDNMRINPSITAFNELVAFGVPQVINDFNSGKANNIADTILMRTLAKVTDPPTGVREEEYRTFETAVGALSRVYTVPKSWVGAGRLTDTGRAEMIRIIQDRFDGALRQYNTQYSYYENQALSSGITIPPAYVSTNAVSGGGNATEQLNLILNSGANPTNYVMARPDTTDTSTSGNSFLGQVLSVFGISL